MHLHLHLPACLPASDYSSLSPTPSKSQYTMAARILAGATARQATSLGRISSSQSSPYLIPRRGLAGAADHHGTPKVNCWKDPMSPSTWKEEHFVIVSLTGWGLGIYGGYKFFTGGKGKKEEKLVEASQ